MREFKLEDRVMVSDGNQLRVGVIDSIGEDQWHRVMVSFGSKFRYLWFLPSGMTHAFAVSGETKAVPRGDDDPVPPLAPGAVVRLKSGGPAMTVESFNEGGVVNLIGYSCGVVRFEKVPAACLVRADPSHGETRAGAGGV